MPLFVLKKLPRLFKDSLIDVTRNLIPSSISALKPRRRADLLCKDFKVGLLGDTEKLHLRTRRAIYIAVQGKHGPTDRVLAKDAKASRGGWEKHLRRRERASSTTRGHRTKLALSPIFQPRCASPSVSSHRSPPVPTRAQAVVLRRAQLRQAKMRARMQRRKEVHRNVRNVFAGHKTAGPTHESEAPALEVPMEDVQPAPLVYAACLHACSPPPTPTMSWFCRNLSQARPAQPGPPVRRLPPLLPPLDLVPPATPMPPSRRGAPAPPVRPVKQAKPVFWGRRAGSPRGYTPSVKVPAPTTPRGPRRTWKPIVRDRILPLTPLPLTPVKSRYFRRALCNRSRQRASSALP